MLAVDLDKCNGCGKCVRNCPLEAIKIVEKKARAEEFCVQCGLCIRLCPKKALSLPAAEDKEAVTCRCCPVQCKIKPGYTGACRRYLNQNGFLTRTRPLETSPPAASGDKALERPLITAVGAGSSYPCCRPSPYIVQDTVDGVELVTVVTEAPLSYSGVKVKLDTNFDIGREGSKVRRKGQVVGMLETEEYGSKMIAIGGANLLTGETGPLVARTIIELCNGERVKLKVDEGAVLELQLGKRPVINGIEDEKMRVGCGSATVGMFAGELSKAADEVIVLDHHVIGLLTEHLAGEAIGLSWSGVMLNARKSTRGRYFGERGQGWGGTNINNPLDIIAGVDPARARPGMTVLVTETTGRKAALLQLQQDGSFKEIDLTAQALQAVELISSSCEEARVSLLYFGGTGGSARAGVTAYPLKLTKAIHAGEASLTIGGAPTFILPGGGINFLVDVEKIIPKAISWVPTPATVAPVEYTMRKDKYREIGGHMDRIIDVSKLRKNEDDSC